MCSASTQFVTNSNSRQPTEIHVRRVESENRFTPSSSTSGLTKLKSSSSFPSSVLKPNSTTTINNPLNVMISKFTTTDISAYSLAGNLAKSIKTNKKSQGQSQDFLTSFNIWTNGVPHEDTRQLIVEFLKCLEFEIEMKEELIKKQELLKLQLLNVYKREKKCYDLRYKKDKTSHKLKSAEGKIGSSPAIILLKETLEELHYSLDIVDEQYVRSINTSLKSSFIDYLITFQNISFKYKEATKNFFEYSLALASNNENNSSGTTTSNGMRKYIVVPESSHSKSGPPVTSSSVNTYYYGHSAPISKTDFKPRLFKVSENKEVQNSGFKKENTSQEFQKDLGDQNAMSKSGFAIEMNNDWVV